MRVVFTVVASQQVSLQVASQSLGGGEDRPATKRNGNVHTMHNDNIKLASKVLHKIHIEINAYFMQDF